MTTTRVFLPLGTLLFLALFVVVTPAAGQGGKWEVEVHGGGILATTPTDGPPALPAAGTPFTLTAPMGSRSSRHVPSWYFGDGAVLLNQVTAALPAIGQTKITALDPVLNSSVAQRQNGGSFGFRISRHINPRYTAEFSFDYGRGPLEMSDTALAGIEASRASFISAFTPRIADFQPATSTAASHGREGHQTFTTGAFDINLKTDGKTIPYATIGGGIVINTGDTPSAALTGNYQLFTGPNSPLGRVVFANETDTVTLRYSIEHRTFVGVLGGGIKYAVTPHWGVRLDVRAHLSKNSVSNLVDANPTVATLTPAVLAGSPSDPTIVWSNNPSTGVPSSLSGPLNGFQTFAGSGMQTQINIVPGFFWRF